MFVCSHSNKSRITSNLITSQVQRFWDVWQNIERSNDTGLCSNDVDALSMFIYKHKLNHNQLNIKF